MKKLIHIAVAILWLASNIGLNVTRHYCGGKYVTYSIYSTPKACCNNPDCCKNESESYQLDENTVLQSPNVLKEIQALDYYEIAESKVVFKNFFDRFSDHKKNIFVPPPDVLKTLTLIQSFLL